MKKIAVSVILATSIASAVSVAEIGIAYANEVHYINKLIMSIDDAIKNHKKMTSAISDSVVAQERSQADMITSQNQTQVLYKQISNYTKMEILRSESIQLQVKELLREDWFLSSKIAKEEIEDMNLD